MDKQAGFTAYDYIIFCITVGISLSIGVVFAIKERRKKRNTPEYYFLAGRKTKIFPVALSFVVTFQSSNSIIGLPAEGYVYGTTICYQAVGFAIATTIAVLFVVPLFHPLKLTSVYQYFHLRFGTRYLQYVTMTTGMIYSVFYMGIVTYGTSLVLEVVLGLPLWASILIYTIVTSIYTSIGGISAVIWTDVFQFVVMVTGVVAVVVKATIDAGGPHAVFDLAKSRFDTSNTSFDPRIRYTVWNAIFGSIPMWLFYNYMQPGMQRVYSTPSVKAARWMYIISVPTYCIVLLLTAIEGAILFAYYSSKGCDIVEAGVVNNINALVPFTVLELFRNQPGLPGLFIASLSSASFSTLSSCLSSLAAITYVDIIQVKYPMISADRATKISKLIVLIYGLVAMVMAFLISGLSGSVVAIFDTFMACINGPTCAVFILCAIFRRATTKGLVIGSVLGTAVPLWINLGRMFSNIPADPYLPSGPVDHCYLYDNKTLVYLANETTLTSTLLPTETTHVYNTPALGDIYHISYMLLSLLGFAVTMVTGVVISLLTAPLPSFDERCLFFFKKHFIQELFGNKNVTKDKETRLDTKQEEVQFLDANTAI